MIKLKKTRPFNFVFQLNKRCVNSYRIQVNNLELNNGGMVEISVGVLILCGNKRQHVNGE